MMVSVCKVGGAVVEHSVVQRVEFLQYYCLVLTHTHLLYTYTYVHVVGMVCAIVFAFLCFVFHLKCTQMEHLLTGPHPHSHLLHFHHM